MNLGAAQLLLYFNTDTFTFIYLLFSRKMPSFSSNKLTKCIAILNMLGLSTGSV